jgi:hypothetical protein
VNLPHTDPPCFIKIHLNISHLRVDIPEGLCLLGFPTKVVFIGPMHAAFPGYYTLHDFISLVIFGEE